MNRDERIKELFDYACFHISNIIPHRISNYDDVLYEEAMYYAEIKYEIETNPNFDFSKIVVEPLLDITI